MRETLRSWRLMLVPVTLLAALPVGAAVIDSVDNTFSFSFLNANDVTLNSSVTCTAGSCRITYSMRQSVVDLLLRVSWEDLNGGPRGRRPRLRQPL